MRTSYLMAVSQLVIVIGRLHYDCKARIICILILKPYTEFILLRTLSHKENILYFYFLNLKFKQLE